MFEQANQPAKIKRMFLYSNGNIAAIDTQGRQVPDLQYKTAIQLWAEFATKLGYDVEGCSCNVRMANGYETNLKLEPNGTTDWKTVVESPQE
jgi:sulfur relay (sulfurtransferase) complex TusBCD TusD component (DsrE family)